MAVEKKEIVYNKCVNFVVDTLFIIMYNMQAPGQNAPNMPQQNPQMNQMRNPANMPTNQMNQGMVAA